MAPARLQGAPAFGWWHSDLSAWMSVFWKVLGPQMPITGSQGWLACYNECFLWSFSRQEGTNWVDPVSSGWLADHFSSLACLPPALGLLCVSGLCLACFLLPLCLLKAIPVLPLHGVSVAHSLIRSIYSSFHPLFAFSFSHEQLWGISHVPRSWEISSPVLHNRSCLSTLESSDEHSQCSEIFIVPLLVPACFPSGSVVKHPPANTGDAGSIPGLGRPPEGGHGNPLQCSYLENPMDRGAWWATVHGVAKSRTWLKRLSNNNNLILPLQLQGWLRAQGCVGWGMDSC